MKTKRLLSFVLAAIVICGMAIPALAEDTIKIGGIGVLTGPYALYGLSVQKGVDLYIGQLNAAGGINGKQVEVIWEDDQGNPTVGIQAYNKLVENDGVVAILGAVLTGVTKAVAEYANDIKIPMITASATADDVTTDRPSVFRTCFYDSFQGVAIARYIADAGIKNTAVLYDNGDEYSTGLYNAFKTESELLGITISAAESASMKDVDFKSQLTNIKNANPEAVFLPYYGAPAALILRQANEIGMNVQFFGADGISDIIDSITDTKLLTKMLYTDHFTIDATSPMATKFFADYEAKYGEKPTVAFSATAYDAALVLTEAIKTAGTTEFGPVVDAIKNSQVQGVTGVITFNDHNDPVKSVYFMTFDELGNKVFVKQLTP